MSSVDTAARLLILMRHAEPVSGSALDDMLIPLSPIGKEREKKLCQEMKRQGLVPEIIIASPCLRTQETAEIAAAVFQIDLLVHDALLEPFRSESLLNLIKSYAHIKTVALVGHGPSLTELANTLLGEKRFQILLAKSSAAALKIEPKGSTLLTYLETLSV